MNNGTNTVVGVVLGIVLCCALGAAAYLEATTGRTPPYIAGVIGTALGALSALIQPRDRNGPKS